MGPESLAECMPMVCAFVVEFAMDSSQAPSAPSHRSSQWAWPFTGRSTWVCAGALLRAARPQALTRPEFLLLATGTIPVNSLTTLAAEDLGLLRDTLRLCLIPGVGPRTRRALLERFGTCAATLAASAEQLRQVPGIGPRSV